jgi:phage repressor protein C with HTH and peptisase S24 domain
LGAGFDRLHYTESEEEDEEEEEAKPKDGSVRIVGRVIWFINLTFLCF